MNSVAFWKRRWKTAFTASCVAVGLSAAAQGATYYVSTSGSDSNPGSQSAPFRHVSAGAAAAHAGDTVIVMDGTYDNEGQVATSTGGGMVVSMSNSGVAGSPITIMAQNRGRAILNAASTTQGNLGCYGAWTYFDLSYVTYVTIQGFVIENACINGVRANGNAHDITIRWNEIRNIGNWSNPAATLSPTGIYMNSSEYNFTFDGNTFHDIGGGNNVNQQHAIYSAASNVTIVNNVFYNQVHGWDIQTSGGRNLNIANNTFAFPNPSRLGHIILWDDGIANSLSNVIIENNVFYQANTYGVVAELDGGGSIQGCTMQYNLTTAGAIFDSGGTYGGGGVSCAQGNNQTSTDPMLMNPSGLDFHLQSGSPAVDTGMGVTYTAVDFDNWSRPVNNAFDRGAFEYHSSAPPPPPPPTPTLSVSASPTSVSVQQGTSATASITATAGGGATPSFSATGLPSGVSYSFSPASCFGSCTTTLTFTASSSAQGSSTVTVYATSGSVVSSANVSVNVTLAPPPPPPPTSGDYTTGLVAEWKMFGNTNDAIGGDTGTLRGNAVWAGSPHLFYGADDPALHLDGISGYMSAPERSQLEMTTQMTVSVWVWPMPSSSPNNNSMRLVAKVWDWDVKMNGVRPQFSANGKYALTNYQLPYYTWTHVVFTFNSGTVTAYINGQPVAITANTFNPGSTLPTYAYGMYFGVDSSLINFFAGSLSDVRIYNRILSGTDVQGLYAAGGSVIMQ